MEDRENTKNLSEYLSKEVIPELNKSVESYRDSDLKSPPFPLKEGITKAIHSYASFLNEIKNIQNEIQRPVIQDDIDALKTYIYKERGRCSTLPDDAFVLPSENSESDSQKDLKTYFDPDFPSFGTHYVENAFGSVNECVKLLPYLLTAFYIKRKKDMKNDEEHPGGCPPGYIRTLFDKENDINPNSRKTIRSAYVDYFSLVNYLPSYLDQPNSQHTKEIEKLKTNEDVIEYLGKPHSEDKLKKPASRYKITSLQDKAISNALAFALCTLACMSSEKISDMIDYKSSFELFNAHTLAFHTIYLWGAPDSERSISEVQEICENANKVQEESESEKAKADLLFLEYEGFYESDTIQNVLSDPDERKSIAEWISNPKLSKEKIQQLKKCGIDSSMLSQPLCTSRDSPEWYKDSAILLAALLHPLFYSRWYPIPSFSKREATDKKTSGKKPSGEKPSN